MEEYIIFVLIVILLFLYNFYEDYNFYTTSEKYCNQTDSDTCVLYAPNIPMDPKIKHKICGKYNTKIKEENIVSNKGKFIFPKQELLYDGIWKSNKYVKDNIETQKWDIIKNQYPAEGEYATDKYLHMPENHMCLDMEVVDKDIYYPNWNKLEMKDRNMYNFDVCEYNKRKNHKGSIVYLEPGL